MAQKLSSLIILSSSSERSSSSFLISLNFYRICWSKLSTLCWYCWLMSVSLSNSLSFSSCRLSSSLRSRDILMVLVLLSFLAASGTASWSAPSPSWNFMVLEVWQFSRGLSLSYFWNCSAASVCLCRFCWGWGEWGGSRLLWEVLLLMVESRGFWFLGAKVLPLTLRRYFPKDFCWYSFQKRWWMLRMFLPLTTLIICSCDFFFISTSLDSSLAIVEDCSSTFCLQNQTCLSSSCILWLTFSPELLRASPLKKLGQSSSVLREAGWVFSLLFCMKAFADFFLESCLALRLLPMLRPCSSCALPVMNIFRTISTAEATPIGILTSLPVWPLGPAAKTSCYSFPWFS